MATSTDRWVHQQLLVDLVNTRHVPDGDDILSDDRALGWLKGQGAVGDQVEPSTLAPLVRLREGLRHLALANNGREPEPEVLDGARAALSATGLFLQFGDQRQSPELEAVAGADPALQILARTATVYLVERAGGNWGRFKACAAADCTYAFLDTSRNSSRRWCEMANCGNRAKNRSWRARHSQAGVTAAFSGHTAQQTT